MIWYASPPLGGDERVPDTVLLWGLQAAAQQEMLKALEQKVKNNQKVPIRNDCVCRSERADTVSHV